MLCSMISEYIQRNVVFTNYVRVSSFELSLQNARVYYLIECSLMQNCIQVLFLLVKFHTDQVE